MTVLIRRALQ